MKISKVAQNVKTTFDLAFFTSMVIQCMYCNWNGNFPKVDNISIILLIFASCYFGSHDLRQLFSGFIESSTFVWHSTIIVTIATTNYFTLLHLNIFIHILIKSLILQLIFYSTSNANILDEWRVTIQTLIVHKNS